jgi:hypothetical protein
MKMKGNHSLPRLNQPAISLALKTNEVDEKIYLSISLPIMVKQNFPIEWGLKTHLLSS